MIRKSTYTLLMVLLVLVALVIFLQRTPGLKNITIEPTSTKNPSLLDWNEKTVSIITILDDQGRVFNAKLNNQQNWIIERPAGCILENSKISNSLTQLKNINVMLELEAPPALVDVGLLNPTYRLTLTFTDGSTQSLSVGSVIPTGSGYYVQVAKDPVVVVTKFAIDSFFELVSTACATPTPEASPTATIDVIQMQTPVPTLTIEP